MREEGGARRRGKTLQPTGCGPGPEVPAVPVPGFTSNKATWSRASRKGHDDGAGKQWGSAAKSISTLAMDRARRRTRARNAERLTWSAQVERIVASSKIAERVGRDDCFT